jgi:peroxiredoxin
MAGAKVLPIKWADEKIMMLSSQDYSQLPENLPKPPDDGAADHLPGLALPPIWLQSTQRERVNLSALPGRTVVYGYPLTGRPDQNVLPEGWDSIPGARGCTLQSCSFRDRHTDIRSLGAGVFGLSVQPRDYQVELKNRLHLPFDLLSDRDLEFTKSLRLPTFEVNGQTYIRRITLILHNGRIEKVFYPVFPPDQNATEVIQ